MPITSTERQGKFGYRIHTSKHQVLSDISTESGGEDQGPNPHELIEAALAACTAITMQLYANRKQIPLDFVDVQVQITEEGSPNHIGRQLKLHGNLTPEQRSRLIEIANKCPIHKFLSNASEITTTVIES